MSLRILDVKWYDAFFLSMLAISAVVVSINWEKYQSCTYPLRVWIVVDYATIFAFRVLMFVDNGLAAGLGPDADNLEKLMRFYGRIVLLAFLALLLYPFLWAWTVIGSLWFTSARSCVPEEGQKWVFLFWLLLSYCGLICIACLATGKWLVRRQAHLQQAQQGSAISEWEVLIDLIRVPEWAFQGVGLGQEMRAVGQETATYHPGLFLTPSQREAVEGLIQQLPKFRLKTVPTECSECPICLEEFCVGNEVRGLPCAHNFHVTCIDDWLRLNIKCPRCRCSVFPNLDLSPLAGHPQRPLGVTSIYFGGDPTRQPPGSLTNISNAPNLRYIRAQPVGQSNLLRLQEILRTMRMENAMLSENIGEERHVSDSNYQPREVDADLRQSLADVELPQRPGVHRTNTYSISDAVVVVDRSPPARF